MELEEKVKELIKWYMDTYDVNKDRGLLEILKVLCYV